MIPLALPVDPVVLSPTPLGGFFMVVAGTVGAVAAVYAIGYVHGPSASTTSWAALATFLLGMQLVPAAADAVSFLLAWELMAAASTVLVLTEHRERLEVRSAALWYAVMTHLSFLLILLGFARAVRRGPRHELRGDVARRPRTVPERRSPSCSWSWASRPRPASCRCTCGCHGRIPRRRATSRP